MSPRDRPFLRPLFALLLALLVAFVLLVFLGENPKVLAEALYLTLFTGFGLGQSLFYATPLIFTGLAVAIANQGGLFNIGAEGQLYLGSLGILCAAYFFSWLPPVLALPLAIGLAAIFGAFWAGIAGVLKAWRGSHEVIVTILLNFIEMSLTAYCILHPFKNPEEQGPESFGLPSAFTLPTLDGLLQPLGITFFDATPVNISLFFALAAVLLCHFFLYKTVAGYELRAVGKNPIASRFAGISVKKTIVLTLAFSGALAGLVGLNDVMGYHHRVIEGFSPAYGFTGIAVALLVRNRPMWIPVSAFLFGALQNCTRELEFLSDIVSKELSIVLQGLVIIFVAAESLYPHFFKRKQAASA